MKQDSLVRSSTLFSIATFTSRIFGLVRDSVIASYMPGAMQGIFWAGIKIPSTFRQLFAEGALTTAFIPLLTRVRQQEGEENARRASHSIFLWLCISVIVVTVAAIWLAPWFVPILLPFPPKDADKIPDGILATQMMFPFLIFVALAAWAMGVHNTYRSFFVPAVAPVFFNITLIVGITVSTFYFEGRSLLVALSVVVVIGGIMQFIVQLPQLIRLHYFPPAWVSLRNPYIGQFLSRMAPAVFGLAIFQLNALITQTYFASKYGVDAISILNYAHRLIQFPLGIVGVALATASFPRIAEQFERDNWKAAARTIEQVTRYMLLLMIPAMAGLAVLAPDIVGLIYNRGEFAKYEGLWPTIYALQGYCVGLIAYAMIKVLVRSFQARHDFKTPVYSGAVAVAVNIMLCALFSNRPETYPLWTLAFSSSIASTVNAFILFFLLKSQVKEIHPAPVIGFGFKVLAAALIMSGACYAFTILFPIAGTGFGSNLLRVGLGVSIGILMFAIAGRFLFWQELCAVLRLK